MVRVVADYGLKLSEGGVILGGWRIVGLRKGISVLNEDLPSM